MQARCLGYIREWLYGVGPLTGPDQVYDHTKEMVDEALNVIDKVGDYLRIKYSSKRLFQGTNIEY